MTHEYKCNSTIDLFATMNLATGEVLTDPQKRDVAVDVLRCHNRIEATVPRGLAILVVLDNLSAYSEHEISRVAGEP